MNEHQPLMIPPENLTFVISGEKQPKLLHGISVIMDFIHSLKTYFRHSGIEPYLVQHGVPYYRSYFKCDEFCITFLEWIAQCECNEPDCLEGKMRKVIAYDLCASFLGKTIYVVPGVLQTRSEYEMYQVMVNWLDLGYSYEDARLLSQQELNTIIFTDFDKFTSKYN